MSHAPDNLLAASARKLTLRMRPDLVVSRQVYQGQTSWAIKEPLTPAYFRFKPEDYFVLQMLDGNTSLDDVRQRFGQQFPAHDEISLEQLWRFISQLHRSNLIVSDMPRQGRELKKRRDQKRRMERLGKFANVLAIRFRGFDPQRLLHWLYPAVRWMYSPLALAGCCTLAVAAIVLITVQFDVFLQRLPSFQQFFGLSNVAWLFVALAFSKVLHELGHGLTCKHFGGECHEIGVLILVLTPCLYCNVSDSWLLPNKWRRIAIAAAGMYVELVLAAICTFLWWFSEPGLLHNLSLYVMFICSVSTVLFNANPLLRFDGYYILADLVEVPNLRRKSGAVLRRTLAWWCLGLEPPHDRYFPEKRRVFFITYAVAAAVYRWLVVALILWFLFKVFEPYRLAVIGQMIAVAAVVGLLGVPLWTFVRFFWLPGRMEEVKKSRLVITLGVLSAAAAFIAFAPLPYYVMCPVEIRPCGATPVYVEAPGKLTWVHVQPGQPITRDMPLAELENLDLQLAFAELTNQRKSLQSQLRSLRQQRFDNASALSKIPQVQAALNSTTEKWAKRKTDLDRLTLSAPCDGWIIAPPVLAQRPPPKDQLGAWSGTPLEKKNQGCHLETKTLFCLVGDPRKLQATLVIDQADIEFVREGQQVGIKLDQLPAVIFPGAIQSISKTKMEITPPQLSQESGGELPTKTDAAGLKRPHSTSYQAHVLLTDESHQLRLGLRGRAKIHVGARTVGQRVWRFLSHTFRFG